MENGRLTLRLAGGTCLTAICSVRRLKSRARGALTGVTTIGVGSWRAEGWTSRRSRCGSTVISLSAAGQGRSVAEHSGGHPLYDGADAALFPGTADGQASGGLPERRHSRAASGYATLIYSGDPQHFRTVKTRGSLKSSCRCAATFQFQPGWPALTDLAIDLDSPTRGCGCRRRKPGWARWRAKYQRGDPDYLKSGC